MSHQKPATKLPWLQDPTGDSGPEYIGPADGPEFVTVAYKKKDAAYIVHACNAYPKLVAALMRCPNWPEETPDLLRTLGEIE